MRVTRRKALVIADAVLCADPREVTEAVIAAVLNGRKEVIVQPRIRIAKDDVGAVFFEALRADWYEQQKRSPLWGRSIVNLSVAEYV
jgi:hypothetical protein